MRVGLVGTSRWAVHVHGDSVRAHPVADLVGVWGRTPERASAAGAELDCAVAATFDELVEACDVLTFAVPPDVQARLALRAATAGRRLVLEKPLTLDVASGQALVDAIGDTPSAVMLTRRWEPRTAVQLQDLAAQGGWSSGRACFVNALTEEFLDASPWRRAHGALWDVGPHALSVLEAVLGRVTDLRAASGRDGIVVLLLRHDSGAVSTAELSLTATPAAAETSVSFRGAQGRSPELPQIGVEEVRAAHSAALSAVASGAGDSGLDASYGLHLTRLLAQAW